MKKSKITKPSFLVTIFDILLSNKLSFIKKNNNVLIKITIGISFFIVLFLTITGLIKAQIPIIKRIFKILLPITFPSTISALLETIDLTETANSGALVPKATIVRPINIFDNLKFCAKDAAPSTKTSAPLIKITKPTISNIISKNIILTSLKQKNS